ncbi:MAG TPA: OmpH family outer membrane protein [Candidatus Saccharimonadales bacterium]|nr:OmpH family outer membrane protein [Candidatus Saccharimonadales bacterium]
MKYWLVVATLALSVSFASAQERMKIGYIDVQRVIAESQSGKRAKERFQVQVKKAEADVQKERQDLERLKSDLDKKGPLLKEEERRSMEADLQKRSVILQRTMNDYQQDLRQKESEIMSEILKEVEQIVNEVGKAEKFTLIFERSQIIYSDQGIDITSKVIETYNSRVKK